jgi:hypothetical protein
VPPRPAVSPYEIQDELSDLCRQLRTIGFTNEQNPLLDKAAQHCARVVDAIAKRGGLRRERSEGKSVVFADRGAQGWSSLRHMLRGLHAAACRVDALPYPPCANHRVYHQLADLAGQLQDGLVKRGATML